MPELPFKKYLPRKIVLVAVGGRRELERHEATKALVRQYPAGLKHARYLRVQVVRLLDDVRAGA